MDSTKMSYADQQRAQVLTPTETFTSITDRISRIVLNNRQPLAWWVAFLIAGGLASVLGLTILSVLFIGVGLFGVNVPVGWGFDIINFVWWIGIGHAGTLISAILLLLRQSWRMSISRFAEAMTLFAVACAALYPIMHTGRPWLAAYWLFPYPNTMAIWPQFRSPLIWDVFAVSTYATVSALFWYVGLIPDLATLRDKAKLRIQQVVYGMLSLGWRGSAVHWHRYEMASLLLAGLSTPLVLSVHSVVSFDFAVSNLPGWHATIFPPYFVAGAIYSGFAMVLTLAIPLRSIYKIQDFITAKHLDNMAKVMLATGLIVAYGYGMEAFMAWYSGNKYERFMMLNRQFGPYWYMYWLLILCNVAIPQLLWFQKIRQKVWVLFLMSFVVNYGMWLERYVIIVTSLHRDFIPSSWGTYSATAFDISMFAGTIGLFLTLFMLFIRYAPMIAMFEVRTIAPQAIHPTPSSPLPLSGGVLAEAKGD